VPKALAYKDGVTYKQRRLASAGGNDPMNRVKSSKGPKVEQAFFYTGPNKSDVGMYRVCVQLSASADSVTAVQSCSNQWLSPACWALSSKPAAVACRWDRRMDARQFHRPCSAYIESTHTPV